MLFYQGGNILNLVTLSIIKVFNYSITDVFDVFVDICFIIRRINLFNLYNLPTGLLLAITTHNTDAAFFYQNKAIKDCLELEGIDVSGYTYKSHMFLDTAE